MTWDPPGPGVWWFTREHFPVPVSRLFASLFPLTVIGWQRAAARYGWPIESTTFAVVNGWLYYSPGTTDWDQTLALEPVAERTLATQSWREEIDRWYDEERPLVLEQNLALQGEDLSALGDAELAGHIDRAIAHFAAVAPLHFEHTGFDIAIGLLLRADGRVGDRGRRGRRVARGRVTRHIGGAEPPRRDRARPDFGADLARRDRANRTRPRSTRSGASTRGESSTATISLGPRSASGRRSCSLRSRLRSRRAAPPMCRSLQSADGCPPKRSGRSTSCLRMRAGCTASVTTTTASASSGRSGSSVVACSKRDGGSWAATRCARGGRPLRRDARRDRRAAAR